MPITSSLRHCSNKYKLTREGEKDYVFFFTFMMKSSSVESFQLLMSSDEWVDRRIDSVKSGR